MTKECPLCTEIMHIHKTIHVTRIPGTTQQMTHEGHEWRCPECDFFEEIDDDDLLDGLKS